MQVVPLPDGAQGSEKVDATLFGLGSSVEHPLHRSADRLVSPMDAADPTTRPAHSFDKFRDHPPHMILPRLRRLDRYRPADPFVARERRDVLPFGERFLQIGGQCMYGSRRHFHGVSIPNSVFCVVL